MAEAVDAIIAEFIARDNGYIATFDKVLAKHNQLLASGRALAAGQQQYADTHAASGIKVANDEEAATAKVTRTRKERTDNSAKLDKAEAASAKAAAKERADAAKAVAAAEKAAAKEAADAVKATEKAERDLQIALARVREGEINDVRKYRAELAKLKQDEKEATNQAKANSFLTSPRTRNGLEPLPASTPRSSRAEMRDVFKQLPSADAKAVIADTGEIDREATSLLRLANIQKTIDEQDARRTSANTRTGPLRGTGNNDGPQRPLASNAAAYINGGSSAPEVAAAKEIDYLTADIATKQAALNGLKGAEKREQQDILAGMRLEKQLRAAGIAEEEILLRLETQRVAVAAARVAEERKSKLASATKFAEGAGIGRGGGAALIGGLVAGAVAGGVVSAAKEGFEYASNLANLSRQLGITTKDLQVYQSGAERLNVTNEQLRESFGQLSANIGKAQEGAKEQGKLFGKDGLAIDLGNAKDGYKSLGDLLPTIVDRFSQIKDPARRAALETALFGEQGRRLDSLLSGGTGSIKALGDELERTGSILSGEDIARAEKTAIDLKKVGDQLERELASTVSQNAAAISSLAKSLLDGASGLLKFIDAFQRFRAQNQINTGDPKLAAQGRATLNQTPEGRKSLIGQYDSSINALRKGGSGYFVDIDVNLGDQPGVSLGGVFSGSRVGNTPAARAAALRQLMAQRQETVRASQAANAANAGASTDVQPGKPGNLNVYASPASAPKGKSSEQIEAERLERSKRFTAAEAQEQLARLGYLSDLTSDTRQQDQYARDRIEIERAAKNSELRDQAEATINRQKLKGTDAAIERSRAEQLVKENDANAELAKQVINRHELSRALDEQLAHALTASDILADGINTQLALAKTVKDRVDLEKRLLAISIENERLALQKQIEDKATTQEARADAQTRLDALGAKQSNAEALINDRYKNPIQRYRDSLDDPETAIQQAVADKLKSVDEAISDAAAKTLGIKDPFLRSLLQIFLEQNVLRPLYDSIQNAQGSGGGIGGFVSGAIKAVGSVFGHRATGGPVVPGASYLVGERGPEVVQFQGAGNVYPNGRLPNVSGSGGGTIVIAPQHYDLSGVVMTESLIAGLREDNRRYADQVGKAAVQASGAQAPGLLQRKQTLEN